RQIPGWRVGRRWLLPDTGQPRETDFLEYPAAMDPRLLSRIQVSWLRLLCIGLSQSGQSAGHLAQLYLRRLWPGQTGTQRSQPYSHRAQGAQDLEIPREPGPRP